MSSSINDSASILLRGIICLGMFYNSLKDYATARIGKSKYGQGFRDQGRCKELLKMGYKTVISLNDGEFTESKAGEHIRANFNYSRSIKREIEALYPLGLIVSAVVLDFYYTPVAWARDNWNKSFLTDTIPFFATEGILEVGGSIYLPNNDAISSYLDMEEVSSVVKKYYSIDKLGRHEANKNPLVAAGNNMKDALREINNTDNEKQMDELDNAFPFFILTRLDSTYYNDFKVEIIDFCKRLETFRLTVLSDNNNNNNNNNSSSDIEEYQKIDTDMYLARPIENITHDLVANNSLCNINFTAKYKDFMKLGVGILQEDDNDSIMIIEHGDIFEEPYGIFISASTFTETPNDPIKVDVSNINLNFLIVPKGPNSLKSDSYSIKSISLSIFLLNDPIQYCTSKALDRDSEFYPFLCTYINYDLTFQRITFSRNMELSNAIYDDTWITFTNKKRRIA